jgi:hypothetical protein
LDAACVRDHWWWRPGWRLGRRLYAWHLTFEDQPELHRMVRGCQSRLGMRGWTWCPWSGCTSRCRGVGFTDEVDEADVQHSAVAATRRCAQLAPLAVTLGPALVWSEGVLLQAVPANTEGPAAPLVEIVESFSPASITVTIPAARLIVVGRDTHVYRWRHPRDGAAGSGRPLAALHLISDPMPACQIKRVRSQHDHGTAGD